MTDELDGPTARDFGMFDPGASAERAAIVAWLRQPVIGGDAMDSVNDTHAIAADAIERGDHFKA